MQYYDVIANLRWRTAADIKISVKCSLVRFWCSMNACTLSQILWWQFSTYIQIVESKMADCRRHLENHYIVVLWLTIIQVWLNCVHWSGQSYNLNRDWRKLKQFEFKLMDVTPYWKMHQCLQLCSGLSDLREIFCENALCTNGRRHRHDFFCTRQPHVSPISH